MRVNVRDLNFFHYFFISKKFIFREHIWVCCGCDVKVINDIAAS